MDEYEKLAQTTERYKKVKKILKTKFGHTKFKPFQYQIIDSILSGKDVLGVMPTGYGKSLCFQIIPLLTNEVAIVISPLVALMADQKSILDKLNITSCCYNSLLTKKEKTNVEQQLIEGKIQILYITPESLVTSHKLIEQIHIEQGICMLAIDEAHCLSSYGFDFRPKYREIVKVRTILDNVPVLAVTATATDKVSDDIKNLMQMDKCEFIKTSFDRPNLTINVNMITQNTDDKIKELIEESDGSTIIYCLTRADTETMAEKLTKYGIKSKAYHSGLEKEDRKKIQEEFMNSEYKCITATIAFGMGINKSDIRIVIHYGCPQNIESYYQEIGRAGRDGLPSKCYLFYKQRDFIIQQKFIDEIKDPKYKTVRNILLRQMSQYVNTSECRRKRILEYFGEATATVNCGNCDNCTSVKQYIDEKDKLKLFQVLNTIMSIQLAKNFSFGASTIALILKGSNGQKIKPWMKDLTYYGSMKKMPIKTVNEFIYKTIEYNYTEDHDIGNCIRVLRCTEQGAEFGKEYEEKLSKMVKNCDFDIDIFC
jgi:RecQ family ATP-dependent DNA helicase